jgi:hypothetical protein
MAINEAPTIASTQSGAGPITVDKFGVGAKCKANLWEVRYPISGTNRTLQLNALVAGNTTVDVEFD